ncbi:MULTISPECIES: transporter [Pseudomonadaceae]|jgi:hypothetical protein|uniref:Transporter n=1 Tax=Stutzerimonas stutzeri TaxID=316 RepID=A0A6I6LWI5_STUST|nr:MULTISPECIES: transporter [Pseudomonadaceae]QGZ32905.1 transporter [Stutzerimonas stutzeri]RPM82144.1 transporter [Pseudomonas aeruginosa]RTY75761.1 transporter [Pseudomonas veronii]|tara:strand:+ start:3943 stop:4872 length:930 start_codon:yes stop_codon:yes gene_type:complete
MSKTTLSTVPALPVRRRPLATLLQACTLALAAGLAGQAQAVDVDAGDYTALPEGTTLGMVYYQHAERRSLYADGHKQPLRAGLDSDIGILRGVHFMKLGGFTIDPQFLLPFGQLEGKRDTKGLGKSDGGIGDLILASTIWLVEQPAEKTYFGITPFLYVPTGRYDRDDALNIGENRWKFALQAGYIQGLGDKWWLDLVGDVTWFGKNDDATAAGLTLRQSALYQGQAFLRYQVTPTFDVRVGYSRLWGGETRLDGLDQRDEPKTQKFTVGAGWFVAPKTQLLVNYGRDQSVENGFREGDRINLRLMQIF